MDEEESWLSRHPHLAARRRVNAAQEEWSEYAERLRLYFTVNDIVVVVK